MGVKVPSRGRISRPWRGRSRSRMISGRDLDLPRHGLEILPLDGTFTPMPNGDYLWRVNDHGKTHREIARHSKLDAEAYDEFGKAMQAMCRFVKPILSMVPP